MELEDVWKEIGDSSQPGRGLEGDLRKQNRSGHPLLKIRRDLVITLGWGVLISLVYLLIMILYPHWTMIVGFGIGLLFNTWIGAQAVLLHRSLPDRIDPAKPLLPLMEEHHAAVSYWIRVQLQMGKFIYPIAACAGFMLALLIEKGDLTDLQKKPILPIAMLITAIIMIPLGHLASKYLVRHSYGAHLKHLQELIDELKNG
jgi:hypothetical protein